jgi:hypothetical protein
MPQSAPQQPSSSQPSVLPTLLACAALLISLASFYGAFFADHPLSPAQKAELLGIAKDLESLQNKEITASTPVQTTIMLNRSYPIKDLFPDTFDIPLEFPIPIDTQLVGVGAGGQPVSFRVQESVPIKVKIPINSAEAFGNNSIRIEKELPVQATFTSSIRIRATYGKDLNSIIDRLEKMGGDSGSGQ